MSRAIKAGVPRVYNSLLAEAREKAVFTLLVKVVHN